jgi:ABC-type multidrug transport system ATPase subunit
VTVQDSPTVGVALHGLRFGSGRRPQRLQDVSLSVRPGELVAVLGASGTGKSTLLSVLAGLLRPSAGDGTVGGAAIATTATDRGGRIGYVPQQDALHGELSVLDELLFAAEIRGLTTEPIRTARVSEVLAALGITALARRRIRELSGGERKRVSVAVELLTAPQVLLLDEPTTGLDPGHERDLVGHLRALADSGCAVVLVTHSVTHLALVDRLLLLGTGGRPLFLGSPAEALAALGTTSFVALFDTDDPIPRATVGTVETDTDPPSSEAGVTQPARIASARRCRARVPLLIRRDLRRLFCDRRTFWLLVLQAPVLGLMIRAMAGPSGLALGDTAINLYARRILLTLVLCAVWLGSTNAIREIVRDRAVVRRERVAGVRAGQVLAAKLAVLWLQCAVQVTVLITVALLAVPGPGFGHELALAAALWGCAGAAGCIALALSALVRSTDQALAILPLLLVPQLVLSGGVLALDDVPALRPVSYLSTARWGLSAAASSTHLRAVETETRVPVPLTPNELHIALHEDADSAWDPTVAAYCADLLVLALIAGASTAVAAAGLRRV